MNQRMLYAITRFVGPPFSKLRMLLDAGCDSWFRILMFHNINNEQIDDFQKIVDFVEENYGITGLEDIMSFDSTHNRPKMPKVVISFDDGFSSQINVTRTILEPRGIKAIFFVCPNFIELSGSKMEEFVCTNLSKERILPEEHAHMYRPMSWSDVRYLSDTGHIIGAHTLNHIRLSSITDEDTLKKEIIDSGDILEDKLGTSIDWFAYPYGVDKSVNANAYKIIRQRYQCCFTGLRGRNTPQVNRYCFRRDSVSPEMPLCHLKFILDGGADFYHSRGIRRLEKTIGIN